MDKMEINIVKNESKELIIEFQNQDLTLPDMIADQLLKNSDVKFAGVNKDHPEIGKPLLVIKTEKKKAKEALERAIEELTEGLEGFKKEISKKK